MTENGFNISRALSQVIEQPIFKLSDNTPYFVHDSELWAFVENIDINSPQDLKKRSVYSAELPDDISAVYYVLCNWLPDSQEKVSLTLGRSAVSVRYAIRKILDLPGTFDVSQEASIQEALFPIKQLSIDPIKMVLASGGESFSNATSKIAEIVHAKHAEKDGLIFVEAEAGKGKTILLATAAQLMQDDKRGKLSVYIPLRKLPLETGVSWESITQLVGIVGEGSERLIKAVKAGLVAIFLDGIDEVSGRYDKKLIIDLLQIITDRLGSEHSVVILSGRRTEARHLSPEKWKIFNVELPDISTNDFKGYVMSVLDGIIAQSKSLVDIPEEYLDLMGNRPADDQVSRERTEIADWIIEVFPEVAKEPSLFFVQGLAAIAIGRRANNRATLRLDNKPYFPPIWQVCLSAAVFACIRECSKVDRIASDEYTVSNQMRVLQGLATLASAPTFAGIPTPNELVPDAFNVDPVNSPEVYVAITRQNSKHALLYATEAAGAYRPHFLSDWIRCSLITQVFQEEAPIGNLSRKDILTLAVSAERARYTFDSLLPSAIEGSSIRPDWYAAFDHAIAIGHETASTNQWLLRASVGDEWISGEVKNPLPLAEITDTEFLGFNIGSELSGEDFFLDGTLFANSYIRDVALNSVSMHLTTFINCEITDCKLINCEGPILFDSCTLKNVKISNTTSSSKPALSFENCTFIGEGNLISQESPAYGASEYSKLVIFSECTTEDNVELLLSGDWLHVKVPPEGISKRESHTLSKSEECLRRALRPFFPSHIGPNSSLQARRYIRLSALGRGSMPAGAPGQDVLQQIFESVGFTTGGRSDHLYGPWSSVVGASVSGLALRNELAEFLRDSTKQSSTVEKMLKRIDQNFNQD